MSQSLKRRSRKAVDVFKRCPRCESPNLLKVEEDVLCTYCDWSSVSVDAPAQCRAPSIPISGSTESSRPTSLASLVDRILEENPFLTIDPVFA